MRVDHAIRTRLLISVSQRVIANAEELTALDRAIGDGGRACNPTGAGLCGHCARRAGGGSLERSD